MSIVEVRHFHLFAGLGGGARGFNRGKARVGNMEARFRCIGGIDVDPGAMRDFQRLAGVPGTVMDLFDREQYIAFHGEQPPADWREATPQDIQRAAGNERPHIVFLSAPCKGFSGLLSEAKSKTGKYQALNRLTLRGVWLMLEAWANDPPEMVLFENVPRLATRGRALLDRITQLLRSYGYATAETTHDCGELGGLAQSRKRFLLVARHIEKVPPLLYQPARRPLRAVGDVLGRMPLPGHPAAGPMHRMPSLQWKTWVRLAFVEAGSDWRSLNKLAVQDGALRDYLLMPENPEAWHPNVLGVNRWRDPTGTVTSEARPTTGRFAVADPRMESTREGSGFMGVRRWSDTTGTVQGESRPSNGAFSVADPRVDQSAHWNHGQHYGVHLWSEPSGAVTGQQWPNQGRFAVADPRVDHNDFHGFRIVRWDRSASTITGARAPGSSAQAVADPRGGHSAVDLHGKYHITPWGAPSRTVIAGNANGAFAVADPRSGMAAGRAAYLSGGHYGVLPLKAPSGAVTGSASHDSGRWSVADPRMPAPDQKLVAIIRALDGTCHRPFTTFELGGLQSLFDVDEWFELDGLSDSAWRERIGNAVPSDAAEAIASEIGRTLLLAWSGETFQLSAAPVWVRNVAIGLSVAQAGAA